MCDGLNRRKSSLPEFVGRALPGGQSCCHAIGKFEVSLPSNGPIRTYLHHHTSVLPKASMLALTHIMPTRATVNESPAVHVTQWLKYYDHDRTEKHSPGRVMATDNIEEIMLYVMMGGWTDKHFSGNVPPIRPKLPKDVELQDLTVAEYGEELVK